MAYQVRTSNAELERTGLATYNGVNVRVFLAIVGGTGFDKNSTLADWETVKLPNGTDGYSEVNFVIPPGIYNTTEDWYQMGGVDGAPVDAVFTGGGDSGFSYDRVVMAISIPDGGGGFIPEPNIAFLGIEDPGVTLAPGVSRTYPINFVNDD